MTGARDDAGVAGSNPVDAFIGLGSNLGDRRAHLEAALQALRATSGIRQVRCSALHETEPVGGPPQGLYLNAVAQLETTLDPGALLQRLLAIESQRGRRRGPQRAAPRTLDLDLLDYAGRTLRLDEPDLVLPHPRMHERLFVLEPFCELAPQRLHPELGVTMAALAERLRAAPRTREAGQMSRRGSTRESDRV